MARVAVALSCSAEQRTELMDLARSRTEEARLVERAKIVLACLEGFQARHLAAASHSSEAHDRASSGSAGSS